MRRAYANHPPFDSEPSEHELAWGLFLRERYGEILEKTIATTYRQRLAHYGIEIA